MPALFRRDEVVTDSGGRPISGVQIGLATQPANTTSFPPTPPAQLYADSAGADPLSTYPETDAYGHASYYAEAGIYTVGYNSPQIAGQSLFLPDQVIAEPYNGPQFNSDSSANGTITGLINGVNTSYNLSAPPTPPASLILMVNGIVQLHYSFLGTFIGLETPPKVGDVLTANYIAPTSA